MEKGSRYILYIHGKTKDHGEEEAGPSKATIPRSARSRASLSSGVTLARNFCIEFPDGLQGSDDARTTTAQS
jgi:hypothetical protein